MTDLRRRWVASLPRLTISREDFLELLEYSSSIPTGKFVGKMWRAQLANGQWVVRGYQPDPNDATMLLIPCWKPRFAFTSGAEFERMAEMWRASLRAAGYNASYANLSNRTPNAGRAVRQFERAIGVIP